MKDSSYYWGLFSLLILMPSFSNCANSSKLFKTWNELNYEEILWVMKDFALALPTNRITFVIDVKIGDSFHLMLTELFSEWNFLYSMYIVKTKKDLRKVVEDIQLYVSVYHGSVYYILTRQIIMEEILSFINEKDLIRRNILYFFYWIKKPIPSLTFREQLIEAARICVITNSKPGLYKVLYNQASPDGQSKLKPVNWWTAESGLFSKPLLPEARDIYKNFQRRRFEVPVLHKPPWNFVIYSNDSIKVIGGRDDKLLDLLAKKFNFRYKYIDPPDRSQGSGTNGTYNGVLGLIWQREVHLFAGDMDLTYERNQAVEFTFPTLADSEVFLTHAPGRLNEALALVRPFQWQVWLLVVITILASGPLLFIIVETPLFWQRKDTIKKPPKHWRVFGNCIWMSITIFLQQSTILPSASCRFRITISIFILCAVYIIGDMYSANLTSILAHPSKEQPISTLGQLVEAMRFRGYQLLVERQSSSQATLENGTKSYSEMWKMMKKQRLYLLDSLEQGMKYVKERRNYALLGGRETFSYETRRFGAQHFHLSEKLNTKYSAIAVQLGCPFLELFNEQLMSLYEAGILNKITEEEYQKLGEMRLEEAEVSEEDSTTTGGTGKAKQDDGQTIAMSMKTLQGSFLVVIVGHLIAVIIWMIELIYYNYCGWCVVGIDGKMMSFKKKRKIKKSEIILHRYQYIN